MQFVQILFVCKFREAGSIQQELADAAAVQLACQDKGLTGFFVAARDGYIGLFEGAEDAVLGQMEYLVRTRKFKAIEVIREISPKKKSCAAWYVGRTRRVEASVERILSPEQLAEFIRSALKPLTKQ